VVRNASVHNRRGRAAHLRPVLKPHPTSKTLPLHLPAVDCFAWACDGVHPDDARAVGALLCLTLHAALLLGSALGFPWHKGGAL
jgi:hypothetical protein